MGGCRLRYLDAGEGPPLLLVHGLGGSWSAWQRNIPALAERHRVIAVDLPGFGESRRLGPRRSSVRGFSKPLAALLRQEVGEPAIVVGHSFGGFVSQQLALDAPELVRGLVLVSGGRSDVEQSHRSAVRAIRLLRTVAGASGGVARIPPLRRAALSVLVNDPGRVPFWLASEMAHGLSAPGFDDAVAAALRDQHQGDPARLDVPVLLIWGERDRLLPVATGRELAGLIPGAQLEVWPHTGHCPMIEHPAQFDARLSEFAARRPGRAIPFVRPARRRDS